MIQSLRDNNLRVSDKSKINPEVHKTQEAEQLKVACQQFESILWAKLWKDMRNSARSISGDDSERPWAQMEDLSLEMASEDLVTGSGGAGLWRSLYDSMIGHLAAEQETKNRLAKANGDWNAAIAGLNLVDIDNANDNENQDIIDSDLDADLGFASRRAPFDARG